jgi:ATP-dependent DNA helicase RecQ
VIDVLAAWAHGDDPWPARPAAVISVGSRRRPELVSGLAQRIASVGRLPVLGTVTATSSAPPPGGGTRANSAQRVRSLHDAFTVPEEVSAHLATLDGPVLLVDDLVDSGWTMAIVARLLRLAGAPAVYPFALAATT